MTISKIISFAVIFVLLIGTAVFQNIYISDSTDELLYFTEKISSDASKNDLSSAKDDYKMKYEKFKKNRGLYSALIEHGYSCDMNEKLKLLKCDIDAKDNEGIIACCASLEHIIECIQDLEKVCAQNIF